MVLLFLSLLLSQSPWVARDRSGAQTHELSGRVQHAAPPLSEGGSPRGIFNLQCTRRARSAPGSRIRQRCIEREASWMCQPFQPQNFVTDGGRLSALPAIASLLIHRRMQTQHTAGATMPSLRFIHTGRKLPASRRFPRASNRTEAFSPPRTPSQEQIDTALQTIGNTFCTGELFVCVSGLHPCTGLLLVSPSLS